MDSKLSGSESAENTQGRDRSVRARYGTDSKPEKASNAGISGAPNTEIKSASGASRGKPKGLKAFLSPGWIITGILIVIFSYAAISFLAPWQLHKDEDIVARNDQIVESFERDVVPFSSLFDSSGEVPQDQEYFRVSLTGNYLPDSEVLLRLRPVDSGPAFQSLTPFQMDDGRVVLINRGYVSSEGTIVPDIEPASSEPTTIVGFARKNEGIPGSAPMQDSGYDQVYGINTQQIGEVTGLDLATDYIQLAEDEPGVLTAMPIPQLDRGSHLSYGFQWIAFGVMAPLGLGYFVWAEMRERRRDKAEREQMSTEAVATGPRNDDEPEAPAANQVVQEVQKPEFVVSDSARRRRSRYGDQHPDHYERIVKRDEQRY